MHLHPHATVHPLAALRCRHLCRGGRRESRREQTLCRRRPQKWTIGGCYQWSEMNWMKMSIFAVGCWERQLGSWGPQHPDSWLTQVNKKIQIHFLSKLIASKIVHTSHYQPNYKSACIAGRRKGRRVRRSHLQRNWHKLQTLTSLNQPVRLFRTVGANQLNSLNKIILTFAKKTRKSIQLCPSLTSFLVVMSEK